MNRNEFRRHLVTGNAGLLKGLLQDTRIGTGMGPVADQASLLLHGRAVPYPSLPIQRNFWVTGKAETLQVFPKVLGIILPVGLVASRAIPLLDRTVNVALSLHLLAHSSVTLEAEGIQRLLDLKGVIGCVNLVAGETFIPLERGVLFLFLEFFEKLLVTGMAGLLRRGG